LLTAAGKQSVSDSFVLDASAVICLIDEETGWGIIDGLLNNSVISAVNVAEVVAKLQERGSTDAMILAGIADLNVTTVDFDHVQAVSTGKLRTATRSKGLSLGDRACLALAASRGAIAVTTDKAWKDFDHIARILLVR
jgi:ribonuclease VapC